MDTTRAQDQPSTPAVSSNLARLPWWAFALLAVGVFFVFLIMTNSNYRDTFIFLQAGAVTTLRITLISFPIAVVIGLIAGLARTSKNVLVFNTSTFYVEVIRGIPMIVLILYTAFAFPVLFYRPPCFLQSVSSPHHSPFVTEFRSRELRKTIIVHFFLSLRVSPTKRGGA